MRRLLLIAGLAWLLAACAVTDNGGGEAASGGLINWNRDPQTVVFRADVLGGAAERDFLAGNDLPLCTVYGDNRVVWTNDLGDFNVQVLWEQVSDQQIQNFVSYLTVVERIYTYDARLAQQPPGEITPAYEQLTLFVNDRQHVTDAFSDWEPEYFQRIVDVCKTISTAPILYEPTAGWVSVREVPYDTTRPSILWEGEAAGLRLADIAASSEPRWVTDNNVLILWNLIRTSSPIIQFQEGDAVYEVVLQIPGIHPDAPPAP